MSTKIKLAKALDKIGVSNGTAPPESQDTVDALIHEYNICTIGESYFKKRRENAKKLLLKSIGHDAAGRIDEAKDSVKKTEITSTVHVCKGQWYSLEAQVKNGASFLDVAALRVSLKKTFPSADVDAAFEAAQDRRDPSVTLTAVEHST